MKNKEFCNYIQTQDSFKDLLIEYKPQLVFLSGSRGVGTDIPTSDYDLIAITPSYNIKSLLGWQDIALTNDRELHVHCYVFSPEYCNSWLNNDQEYPKSIVSDLWFQNILALKNIDNLIINNDDDLFDFWITHQQEIVFNSLYKLFTKHWEHQKHNLKFLGHCILCYDMATFSECRYDYIKQIKQQRYNNNNKQLLELLWKELTQKWNEFSTIIK